MNEQIDLQVRGNVAMLTFRNPPHNHATVGLLRLLADALNSTIRSSASSNGASRSWRRCRAPRSVPGLASRLPPTSALPRRGALFREFREARLPSGVRAHLHLAARGRASAGRADAHDGQQVQAGGDHRLGAGRPHGRCRQSARSRVSGTSTPWMARSSAISYSRAIPWSSAASQAAANSSAPGWRRR